MSANEVMSVGMTTMVRHSGGRPDLKSSLGKMRGGIARLTSQFTTGTLIAVAGSRLSKAAPTSERKLPLLEETDDNTASMTSNVSSEMPPRYTNVGC